MKKLTIPKISLLVASPISVGLISTLATSCGSSDPVKPSQTQLTANENDIATLELEFNEQPKYNDITVNIRPTSGIELEIVSSINSYEKANTVKVVDKKATVYICPAEKQISSTKINFDLDVSYIDNNNKLLTTTVSGLKLKLDVDPEKTTDEVHILSINDLHGNAPGYGTDLYKPAFNEAGVVRLARDMNKTIEQYPGSLMLSAGDNVTVNVFSDCTHGETVFPILSTMNIQYSAVGNHAFDWGIDNLATGKFDNLARTSSTVGNYFLASNILNTPDYSTKKWVYDPSASGYEQDYQLWKNQMVRWADPYKILNMKGHRVCVIGLTTQKTKEDGNADYTQHFSFIDYIASVNYAKQYCLENIGQKDFDRIESFILLTHVESDYPLDGEPIGAAIDLAKNIDTNIDGIISAHSHKQGSAQIQNDKLGKKVWVGQASKHGRMFLDTKLVFDNTKSFDQRLSEVSMEVKKPSIDYGDNEPTSGKGFECARNEYNDLIKNPPNDYVKKVADEYLKQAEIVENLTGNKYAMSEYGAAYDTKNKNLGHEYIWFDKVVEPMGAWMERASLYGFKHLIADTEEGKKKNINAPWISFIGQNSITHSWAAGDTISAKDMYALQTYEDHAVLIYLTVGQLTNILNYMLCGEQNFNYDENKVYPGKLNTDINLNECSGVDLESSTGLPEHTSNYLCGPLQFWGVRIALQKNTDPAIDARYQIPVLSATTEEGKDYNYPQIWIYNPHEEDCDLEDPKTWVPASKIIEQELTQPFYIPVVISSFEYEGKLASNRMFKYYALYNAYQDWNNIPIIDTHIMRDLLIDYCEHYRELMELPRFDVPPYSLENLVIVP